MLIFDLKKKKNIQVVPIYAGNFLSTEDINQYFSNLTPHSFFLISYSFNYAYDDLFSEAIVL